MRLMSEQEQPSLHILGARGEIWDDCAAVLREVHVGADGRARRSEGVWSLDCAEYKSAESAAAADRAASRPCPHFVLGGPVDRSADGNGGGGRQGAPVAAALAHASASAYRQPVKLAVCGLHVRLHPQTREGCVYTRQF